MTFIPETISAFRFISAVYNEDTRTAELSYALDDKYFFTESYKFPAPLQADWQLNRKALQIALNLLHLAAGVSYYKTAVPSEIIIENQSLTKSQADFFTSLYLHGLGEFSYKNDLSIKDRISFPYSADAEISSSNISLPKLIAVPLGGGKDSLLTLEALLRAEEHITPIALGDYDVIRRVSKCRNLPLPIIERKIDPLLLELNNAGAYNGHVPISAIIVFSLAAAAVTCGFDTIAISQERSANEPNVLKDGLAINHQYSKSFEFEVTLQQLLRQALPSLHYFSFLRPLSELGICQLFAKYCSAYFHEFSSCNRSFSSTNPLTDRYWCCNCPKCRFIFLALAPFIGKEEICSIFGENLLNNEAQLHGYYELLGLTGYKPFECVGEIKESRAAFALLAEKEAWQNDLIINSITEKYSSEIPLWRAECDTILTPADVHAMPKHFEEILRAL